MVSRYIYSIIRCVPDPRTGEFVNVGALAGDPITGDWSIRQLSNESRIRRFAQGQPLLAAHAFMSRVGEEIDRSRDQLEAELGEPLGEEWLNQLCHDHRNVVQLSAPQPLVAEDAEQALDVIFGHMIIDPVAGPRETAVTKHRLVSDLREAYRRAEIAEDLVRPRSQIFVGARLHSTIDIAIANGRALQLTQAWSFRRAGVDEVSTQVKAWGYALEHLRRGEEARLLDAVDHPSTVARNVDIQVVVALPMTPEQHRVYEEAQQVFSNIGAEVHPLADVNAVGIRAARLVQMHT